MNKNLNFLLSSLFLLSTAASLCSSEEGWLSESEKLMLMPLLQKFLTPETSSNIIKALSKAESKEEVRSIIFNHTSSDPRAQEIRKSFCAQSNINPIQKAALLSFDENDRQNSQQKALYEKKMSKRISAIESEEKSLRQTMNQEYDKHLKDIKRFHSKFEERQLQKKEEVRLLQLKEASSRDELIKSDDKFFQDMQQRFATEKNKIRQKEQSQKAKLSSIQTDITPKNHNVLLKTNAKQSKSKLSSAQTDI